VIRTGKIAKYDYVNPLLNILHYGQLVPPTYDITKILSEFPIFFGYGGKDFLSDVEDVKILLNDLNVHNATNRVALFKEDYAHVDYIAGFNATQVVYDPMITFFNAH
jgi:lysosomal acid lipase/cholesteryl ester hydrolase